MSAAEVISSHRRLYQRGAEIGLYDDAFGEDLAELWNRNRTKTSTDVLVEEEQSRDSETAHVDEDVGWLAVPTDW